MQRRITNLRRSDDEVCKESGLLLDFDEIARHGKMTLEESKIAKAYGIYTTRHPNYFMARVTVPGGVLTISQLRALSEIIEAYAQGRICLTTRQALQMHFLSLGDVAPMMRELAKFSLTTPVRKDDIVYGPIESRSGAWPRAAAASERPPERRRGGGGRSPTRGARVADEIAQFEAAHHPASAAAVGPMDPPCCRR